MATENLATVNFLQDLRIFQKSVVFSFLYAQYLFHSAPPEITGSKSIFYSLRMTEICPNLFHKNSCPFHMSFIYNSGAYWLHKSVLKTFSFAQICPPFNFIQIEKIMFYHYIIKSGFVYSRKIVKKNNFLFK